MKPMPNGPPVTGSRLSAHELDDDRDAEGGDGQIVGAQPDRQRADQEGRPGRRPARRPASRRRSAGRSRRGGLAIVGRGQERRDIGADRHEAGDADIEQAGLAPLHIEAEADDGEGQRHGQEEGAVAEQVELIPPSRTGPAAATSSTATRMTKATAARHSAPIELHGQRFGEADDQPGEHRARHAADAAEDRRGEQRQQQVEAHVRPDLHQQAGHDAGDAGERRRRAARRRG